MVLLSLALVGLTTACALPRSGLDSDASTRTDGAADATRPDAPAPDCVTASDCVDDSVGCTTTTCEAGLCQNRPDDGACTDGADGRCDPLLDCQYATCNASSCSAGPCETARCVGSSCVREPACGDFEMCCGDACVPLGCDDGDDCTNDSCGATGCEHAPNAAPCDDGVFCNGADQCAAGECSVHPGDPCSGTTVCDELDTVCVGCVTDADCPADTVGAWATCGGFADTCDESGMQERTRTVFTCEGDVCRGTARTDSRACSRDQSGAVCGDTIEGPFDACGGFGSTCGESGTQSRMITERRCGSGVCNDMNRPDTRSCNRDTDADSCGATTMTPWTACGGFAGTCGESGTQTRTVTDRVCAGGSCGDQDSTLMRDCSRVTENMSCGMSVCGGFSSCDYAGTCDEAAMRTRSCTDPVCQSGSCGTVTRTEVDTSGCTRSTDGNGCGGGSSCGAWGTCTPGSDVCSLVGTQQRTCTDQTCAAGACGTSASSEMQSCALPSTDGVDCDDGNACTVGDACSGGTCAPGVLCPGDPGRPCGDPVCELGVCVEARSCTECSGLTCDPVTCSCG